MQYLVELLFVFEVDDAPLEAFGQRSHLFLHVVGRLLLERPALHRQLALEQVVGLEDRLVVPELALLEQVFHVFLAVHLHDLLVRERLHVAA